MDPSRKPKSHKKRHCKAKSKDVKQKRNSSSSNIIDNESYQRKLDEYKEQKNGLWPQTKKIVIYATKHNKHKDLKYLHRLGKLKDHLNTILRYALLHQHENLGIWALNKGANLIHIFGQFPLLHFASSKGYLQFTLALLKQSSADEIINAKNADRETALHIALRNGNPEICRLLLQLGAKTDLPDRYGLQPLHRAVQIENSGKMIDLLLEFNADINAVDKYEKCPLEYAFGRSFNKQTVVCHLIERGANVGIKFVSNGPFRGKNAVQVSHMLGMTKSLLRAVRSRNSKANKHDLSVIDCVDSTGDIGALVDILQENGDISSLCALDTCDTIKRLLSYVRVTGSHRLHQCLKERGLLVASTPSNELERASTQVECSTGNDISTNGVEDISASSSDHMQIIHFEEVDDDQFLLSRGKKEHLMKSKENVVVVSSSKNERCVQKVIALAAQHMIHEARGIIEDWPIQFMHLYTNTFLTETSLEAKTAYNLNFKQHFKVEMTSPYDGDSLHHYILQQQVSELTKTLDSCDVNTKDGAGWTPLNLAILMGDKEMVEILLDRGATPTSDVAKCLPAFVCGNWDENLHIEISSFILATRFNLEAIVQMLVESYPWHLAIDSCIKLSYGMSVERTLLEAVCKEAERKYQSIGSRFQPTYTARVGKPIQRVCLGFSEHVCGIEDNGHISGVQVDIINKEISPETVWREDTEMTEDERTLSKEIIHHWADYLWDHYSNLNAISAGSIARISHPDMTPTGHIILHCSHKGFIPLESMPFPPELMCQNRTMPVAVLEGEFRLGPIDHSSGSRCKKNPTDENTETQREPVTGDAVGTSNTSVGKDLDTDGAGASVGDETEHNLPETSDRTANVTIAVGRRYPMATKEHVPLKVGMHLCKSEGANDYPDEGTLGIFVDMDEDKTGFVTCAHLFYKDDIRTGRNQIYFPNSHGRHGAAVIAPLDHFEEEVIRKIEPMEVDDEPVAEVDINIANNIYWECGTLVRAVLDSTLETGIDAALIEIDPSRVPKDGAFDNIKNTHLRNAADVERPVKCMKLGASSGLSVGILTCEVGQVRFHTDLIADKYIFKNQYVISEYNRKQFFEHGDSGSAVFVIRKDQGYPYPDACLGIAIGFLNKKTFVTPIGSILQKLKTHNEQELKLKKFQ
ncbi:uncharacterized protein [Argopecten irradians]|uniref:uncharacterized protein isoform X2 n=1 Tax=Argopecten irradians TaxID=31199 RepID=UPI00371BCD13